MAQRRERSSQHLALEEVSIIEMLDSWIVNTYAFVTSGDSKEDTSLDSLSGGGIESLIAATSKRHVHDSLSSDTSLLGVFDTPVDTLDDAGGGARALAVKDLDGDDVGKFGNTVFLSSDSSSGVSAVSIVIRVALIDNVGSPLSTVLEVGVGDIDTSIDTVEGDVAASRVVVGVVSDASLLAGDAAKSPRRSILLGDELGGPHDSVGLDPGNLICL